MKFKRQKTLQHEFFCGINVYLKAQNQDSELRLWIIESNKQYQQKGEQKVFIVIESDYYLKSLFCVCCSERQQNKT